MWWNQKAKAAETLLEEHVKRLWDMKARLTALEDRFEASLDELAKRYRRAEQAERKRAQRGHGEQLELEDEIAIEEARHPAIVDLLSRRGPNASDSADSGTG